MANLISVVTAAQGRKRKCPQCGHKQAVSPFLATQSVACHRCAAAIPPQDAKSATKGSSAGKSAAKDPKGSRR
jgi:uncharacterized paraquat-inducible protein A